MTAVFTVLISLSVCFGGALAYGWGGYGDHFHHAKPHHFGYVAKGHGGESHHHESGVGGHAVHGSYGYTDAKGIFREVNYVADHGGFRAEVKTNEPGTISKDSAHVKMHSSGHPYLGAGFHGGYGGHGAGAYGGLGGHYGHHDYGHHGYGHHGYW